MKKALVVLLGVLMAVMFAAESYAATEVGGTIDVRGRLRENNNDLNSSRSGNYTVWQEKINLWVDAKIAEGLKGYIELQTGNGASKGWFNWGVNRGDNASNQMMFENEAFGTAQFRYAYIDFMVPGTPVGMKIGHMPVIVGHSIWADTKIWGSDGLMIYAVPIKELMIALGTIKGLETATNGIFSDVDMYGLHVLFTFMPKNTIGLNVNYLNRSGKGDISGGAAAQYDMAFYNIMVTADGALDFGLGYKFEADLQAGALYDYANAATTDISGSGYALLLGVDFKIADIAKVGMDLAYGSGDKCDTFGAADYSACTDWGKTNVGYVNFNDYGYTMIYEDIVGQKRAAGILGTTGGLPHTTSRGTDFGLYNTMYAKLGAGATPIKDMSVGLNFFYLLAVQENIKKQKNDIGYEFDLTFKYKIYKNLAWSFMAGYFIPGGHYEKLPAETDSNKTVDAAYAFEQKLSLKF